jgi:hypothetical protein
MIMKNRVGREENFSIFHKIHRCENYSTDKQKIGVEMEKRVKNEIEKMRDVVVFCTNLSLAREKT